MAVTYTWTIPTLERHTADGGVYIAHWRCTGVDDDGNTASSYGTCGLEYDASAADFTPYADITQDQAQGWIWVIYHKRIPKLLLLLRLMR